MSEENENQPAPMPATGTEPERQRRPRRRFPRRRNGSSERFNDSNAAQSQGDRNDGDRIAAGYASDLVREQASDGSSPEISGRPGGEQNPDRDQSFSQQPQVEREPEFGEGVIEISGKGFGFLRDAKRNFVQTPSDIFVTPEIVRRFCLRDGMWIYGETRRGNRGPQLTRLLKINDDEPTKYQDLRPFEELTTINPNRRIKLETVPDRYTTRVMDLMTPLGMGQRGLIVAPPRTGKTTLLQHIADAVVKNNPEMKLIILLVDERPEEVTEIRRTVPSAEMMASSNDSDIKSHTRIAQLAIERAKRLVEAGKDVFILLDSITRTARAFNNATGGGGRTMSGGIDARAMEIPRRLFSAARNTEEAGSLTIVATALIETGSRMDELIFQEFKGTGNMELVLDRKISDQRVYPAIDIFLSGTRREELLLQPWELEKINLIRRGLAGHKPGEAIERLLSFVKKFPTNDLMLKGIPG
jgi:transcription termination factor Rho